MRSSVLASGALNSQSGSDCWLSSAGSGNGIGLRDPGDMATESFVVPDVASAFAVLDAACAFAVLDATCALGGLDTACALAVLDTVEGFAVLDTA